MLRAGLIQLCASDDPVANLPVTVDFVRKAARGGAHFVLTPEMTNCISQDRDWQAGVLQYEADDLTLAALRREAADLEVWLLIGSLGLRGEGDDDRFVNRSFLISPGGDIVARYDKLHMFDVQVSATETFRESTTYRPGSRAMLGRTDFATIGMSICYDLRFADLYRRLAKAGAQILSVPSAFTPVTGAAHWQTLLRARAIETGCFVLAPAQTGDHPISTGKPRQTWGHSLAVSPWGSVLADDGDDAGVTLVDLDLAEVEEARRRIPALSHDLDYAGPQ
jgi:deaminated glutathione amidase